jgi:hypothetical protein
VSIEVTRVKSFNNDEEPRTSKQRPLIIALIIGFLVKLSGVLKLTRDPMTTGFVVSKNSF